MTPDTRDRQPLVSVVCPRCAASNGLRSDQVRQPAACGSCGQFLFIGETLVLDDTRFDRHVAPSDLPVAVVFWASWSPAARQLAREARLAGHCTEPGCRVAVVDGEQEQPLIARLGVRALPSVVVYRSGTEVARHEGPLAGTTLAVWLHGVLAALG